jgi:hypothetical protein
MILQVLNAWFATGPIGVVARIEQQVKWSLEPRFQLTE